MSAGIRTPAKLPVAGLQTRLTGMRIMPAAHFPLIGISIGKCASTALLMLAVPAGRATSAAISAEIAIPLGERTCPAGATTAGLRPVVSKCALRDF